ncbi:TolC family protein, partial [Shigella sonnei]|nr:RND transporter [Shigella sonnei]
PQLSGGLSTGDMTTGERGRQLLSLNAIQMLYDFGKVRSGVNTEQARLQAEQANVLVSIDEIALEVANAVINIKRYQELSRIAQQQISGIQ